MQNTKQTNTLKARLITLGFLIILSVLALSLLSCSSKKSTENGSLELLNVGDTISFGPHQWQVLDVKSDRALIITTRSITEMRFCPDQNHIYPVLFSWENSEVRKYLQAHLASNAFSNEERARAIEVLNPVERNPYYDSYMHGQTNDKIFLLSAAEVVQYFGDSGQLGTSRYVDDQYNANRLIQHSTINENHSWWLRTPGGNPSNRRFRAAVYYNGVIDLYGLPSSDTPDYPGNTRPGVRPAMWIKL